MGYAWSIAFTLFVWWFSTGVILYLDGLPRRTFKWTMLGFTVLLGAALGGLAASSRSLSPLAAYCSFTCAILIWAWQEVAFLLGYVTGPSRAPCPSGSQGWRRAGEALQTVLHHELALVALALAVWMITWGQPNQTGLWAFLILWVMRQSAKLNVFLGVRNLNEDFLPLHLAYIGTYFRRRPLNPLFPVSVTLATLLVIPMWQAAVAHGVSAFDATALSLLGSLLGLAILEHWLMVLPLPSQALWKWGLRSRGA